MPAMSGLEVAEVIASSQTIDATKMRVIMLGSIDVHRNIAACPHVHGFTTKPIRRQPLIKMIVEQLKIKRGMLRARQTPYPLALREDDLPSRVPAENNCGGNTAVRGAADLGANRPNPLSILYVEDNLINQKVIVGILSRWKCKVTTALNGLAGFEERISHRGKDCFDLILCKHVTLARCIRFVLIPPSAPLTVVYSPRFSR